jgi:hypothetical protein
VILSRPVSLPYASFLTAWLAIDLGELPTALLPARPMPACGSFAEVTDRAWEDLYSRDLAVGRGLTDELEGTLRRLATAATRYYAFFHEGDGDTQSALVARSVVATVDGNTITLRQRSGSAAQALIEVLPALPKGSGTTLSAPADELARLSGPGVITTVRPTGVAATAARMRWLLSQPRTGGGQLYTSRRDRHCVRPLSYVDIAGGRYLATEDQTPDGIRWRTLVPAGPGLLIRWLRELVPR